MATEAPRPGRSPRYLILAGIVMVAALAVVVIATAVNDDDRDALQTGATRQDSSSSTSGAEIIAITTDGRVVALSQADGHELRALYEPTSTDLSYGTSLTLDAPRKTAIIGVQRQIGCGELFQSECQRPS